MAPIRSSDLLNRLVTQASEGLKKADANKSGTVTRAEDAALPSALKQEVTQFRAAHGSVRSSTFLSKFEADVRAELARVDTNHDGMISDADQARLAAWLKDNVASMGSVTPGPGPITPQTAFGISGTIPSARVELHTVLASGLDKPTAVAENPRDHSVWIVNEGDDSSVVIDPQGRARHFQDDSAHFMNNPTAIAFSRTRNEFATVQDTTNDYNGHAMANMFMGPTVWTGDRTKFEGGTNSHLDMLHHSPEAMGIAAGEAAANDPREYWVFNGHSGSIDRYFSTRPTRSVARITMTARRFATRKVSSSASPACPATWPSIRPTGSSSSPTRATAASWLSIPAAPPDRARRSPACRTRRHSHAGQGQLSTPSRPWGRSRSRLGCCSRTGC